MRLFRALVVTLFFSSYAFAQATEVGGAWDIRLNAPDGPQDATLTLTRTGETLSGVIKGARGEFKVQGTVKGNALSVTYAQRTDAASSVTLKGEVTGNTIGGQATFGNTAGSWSGKRATAASGSAAGPAIDLTGVWAFEVTSPFGKGTPTVTFKQGGESLTGTYVGQMGEVPLEGTLKGTTLSFATEMTVAKLKVRILYTGTAAKDELKGTIKYGELGEGVFTGHRK